MASGDVEIKQPERGFFTGRDPVAVTQGAPTQAPAPAPPTPAPAPAGSSDLLELAEVVRYLQGHGVNQALVAQVITAVLAFKPVV